MTQTARPAVDSEGYRDNVGVVLFNDAGRVWCGRRTPSKAVPETSAHRWQWPQGGVDAGEAPQAAALRELAEETGTARAELLAEAPEATLYDFPPDYAREGRRGQRQIWFAFLFLGSDDDFDLHAGPKPEFDAWEWRRLDESAAMVVPFKRPVYERVVEWFRPLADALAAGRGSRAAFDAEGALIRRL